MTTQSHDSEQEAAEERESQANLDALDDELTDWVQQGEQCGWNPTDAVLYCDWDENCPVHGAGGVR